MKFLRLSLSVAVFLCAVQAVTAQVQTAQPAPVDGATADTGERYRIGFQDILDVQIFRHSELSQRVAVSPNGTIVLFRLDHPVVAVCKTERELAEDIAAAYRESYLKDPRVNVVVAEQRSQSVAVIGAVEKPGNYFINRRYHLLEMIALAGGPNKEAGTRLLIARTGSTSQCRDKGDDTNGDQVTVADFKIRDIQEGKQTFWMQPGDVVSVLESDVVYVYGDVKKQGSVRVKEPITLTQAIASAEGLRPTAKKGSIRILRQKQAGGDREELVFDLNQIDKGKLKDPYLESGDIVAVSEDGTKKILLGVASAVKSSVPSALYRLP
jgi:polysaccharide export outer membrane protein